MIVRSAGFLADLFIQYHEHTSKFRALPTNFITQMILPFTSVIDTHSETAPSLRLDKPFDSLLMHARALDFESLDVTDHSHIPFVIVLIKALEEWKSTVSSNPPFLFMLLISLNLMASL